MVPVLRNPLRDRAIDLGHGRASVEAMFVCPECGHRQPAGGACPAEGQGLVETTDALLGSDLGRYRLTRVLGEGGMGRVYLAIQPAIGSRVAVKVLSEECARSAEMLERFFAEARAVNLIRHENIVGVLDLARLPDGRPYIMMEFIEGQTLGALARRGPLPIGGVVQATGEVLAALAAAHAIGIVHRDLKPDNVLITVEGHAKVLDFGIAKLAPGLQHGQSPRTQTGAILGTPAYMAPEQIVGGTVDGRSDVYSAGVMLYEALTGRPPFAGETLFALMQAHLDSAPPPPRALRPELPAAIEAVILTALAKAPEARFATAAAMGQALVHASATLPPSAWQPLSSRNHGTGPRLSADNLRLSAAAAAQAMPSQAGLEADATLPTPSTGRRAITRTSPPAVTAQVPPPASARRWPIVVGLLLAGAGIGALVIALRQPSTVASPAPAVVITTAPPAPPPAMPAAPGPTAPTAPPARAARPSAAPTAPPAAPTAPPAAPAGPIIVGGGSAVDHGVVIGPGVVVGPGVLIGGGAPAVDPSQPMRLAHTADYDPRHFDPSAYVGRARAMARQLYADAELIEYEIANVYPDGHADLKLAGDSSSSYEFRSPSHSARPAGVPRNAEVDLRCRIIVTVGPDQVEAAIVTDEHCRQILRGPPRCTVAQIWARAIADGTPGGNVIAKVGFLHDGTWFFDGEKGVQTFDDRCP
jgi:serine/threonine protein kinase